MKVLYARLKKTFSTFVNFFIFFLLWEGGDLLSGKLHKDGDCENDDEIKDGEFVHFLANTGLPTLWRTDVRLKAFTKGKLQPAGHYLRDLQSKAHGYSHICRAPLHSQ